MESRLSWCEGIRSSSLDILMTALGSNAVSTKTLLENIFEITRDHLLIIMKGVVARCKSTRLINL